MKDIFKIAGSLFIILIIGLSIISLDSSEQYITYSGDVSHYYKTGDNYRIDVWVPNKVYYYGKTTTGGYTLYPIVFKVHMDHIAWGWFGHKRPDQFKIRIYVDVDGSSAPDPELTLIYISGVPYNPSFSNLIYNINFGPTDSIIKVKVKTATSTDSIEILRNNVEDPSDTNFLGHFFVNIPESDSNKEFIGVLFIGVKNYYVKRYGEYGWVKFDLKFFMQWEIVDWGTHQGVEYTQVSISFTKSFYDGYVSIFNKEVFN